MLKFRVTQVAVGKSGILCGLRIDYGQGGPVRFATVTVPYSVIDTETRQALAKRLEVEVDRYLYDEPLF
jgi:hypothetical protein